jgi:tRNA A37 threonylcarbamoyladenosine biosynthesis protein TsaE
MSKKIRHIICVVGKTGYGKSYLVKSNIVNADRCVVFDLQGEYDLPGFIILEDFHSFKEHLKLHHGDDYLKVICRFDNFDDYENAFEICYIVGQMIVVIEEVSNFSNASGTTPALEKCIRFGRHTGLSVVGISQRFADMSLLWRNNLDLLVCFNLSAPNDIKYLSELPYVAKRAEEVAKLKPHESITFVNM